jgi:hypothetical protein
MPRTSCASQAAHNHRYRQAGAPNDGFAVADGGVDDKMRFGVVMVTQMIVIWLDLSSLASRDVNLVGFWAMRRETSAPGGDLNLAVQQK